MSKTLFAPFFVLTTIIALAMGFVWFISPLGLGFQDWPSDPTTRNFAFALYQFSYFIGLPLLLIGQIGALVLAANSKMKAAYRLPLFTMGIFIASVAVVLWMIESGV